MSVTIAELAKGLGRSKPYIRGLLQRGTDSFPPLWDEHVDKSGRTYRVDDFAVQAVSDYETNHAPTVPRSSGNPDGSVAAAVAIVRDSETSMLREEIERLKESLKRADGELARSDAKIQEMSDEIASLKTELRGERAENNALRNEKSSQADTIARLRGELVAVERAGLFQRLRGFSFAGLLTDGTK